MKVVIFEACRSPHKEKPTEGILLSRFFKEQGIEYKLFSNDFVWPKEDRVNIDADLVRHSLAEPDVEIAHFAVHGDPGGLVLQWHDRAPVPEAILTWEAIEAMTELDGTLVVSGACASARYASFFLSAGVRAVVAPKDSPRWPKLGHFFVQFYGALFSGEEPYAALTRAKREFPEFKSYCLCPSDDPICN